MNVVCTQDTLDVALCGPKPKRLWGYHIDAPKPGSRIGGHAINIMGWVLGRSCPAVAVELMNAGNVVRRVPVNVRRQDVADVYTQVPGAERSGFQTTVSVLSMAEPEVLARAVLRDQRRVPLGVIRVTETPAEDLELQPELFQGLLHDCYEFHGNTTDFWRFQTGRADRFKAWIKDRLLLFAKRNGFVPRDPAIEETSRRLMYVMENLDGLENSYRLLRDRHSKQLFVELLKFKILGEKRVKLPLNNDEYWDKRKSIDKKFLKKRRTFRTSWNWYLNHYQLQGLSGALNLHADPLTILEIFLLEQYAYQKRGKTIQAQPGDVVIDGGGLWGDTALYFADKILARGKVYCFEFAPENLEVLRQNIELNQHLADNIRVIPKALWHSSGETIGYSTNGPGTSLVADNEQRTLRVSTISIDDLVEEERLTRVDYIKLDIEGSELKALRGAEKTIRAFRPKLAISLYHREDDFIAIPDYLDKLSLRHELFLDHFTIHAEETVLFANPER